MTASRPRVLWITNMFPDPEVPGAHGIFVGQQYKAIRSRGSADLEVVEVAGKRGGADYLLANLRVGKRWRGGGFDLAHVHYGLAGLATLLLPRDVPLVFTFYGSDINLPRQRAISRWVAGRARRRIFVARRLADQWPSERNVVCPNGIDFEVCRPIPREAACRALGLDPTRKWILFGARPENAVKGYDLFRDVLNRVRRRHPEAEALILTEPGQPYERVVEKHNAADVLLFTSRRGQEGSPTVVKEALAVGLPVVTVDVGDVRDMLDGVEPGAVVDWPTGTEDQEAWRDRLADRVVGVLGAGQRSDGRNKRDSLRGEKVADRIVEIYRDVIGETRAGR